MKRCLESLGGFLWVLELRGVGVGVCLDEPLPPPRLRPAPEGSPVTHPPAGRGGPAREPDPARWVKAGFTGATVAKHK